MGRGEYKLCLISLKLRAVKSGKAERSSEPESPFEKPVKRRLFSSPQYKNQGVQTTPPHIRPEVTNEAMSLVLRRVAIGMIKLDGLNSRTSGVKRKHMRKVDVFGDVENIEPSSEPYKIQAKRMRRLK